MSIAPSESQISITPTPDGAPAIRWDMSVEQADTVMTLLARAALSDPSRTGADLLDTLYLAVSRASDALARLHTGCEGLWPDAAPMTLTEPAVLGDDTGDFLSVLIPGQPSLTDAACDALNVAREAGAQIDTADETLYIDVHAARWMVLNACESTTHDFHPELAAQGPRTPGATLVTRVDIARS